MVRQSISTILADRAASAPGAVMLVDEAGAYTAAELDDAATHGARVLIDYGVRPDDLVSVALPNGRDHVIACFAIWRAGATPQLVSRALLPEERRRVDETARPAAAIGHPPQAPNIPWVHLAAAPSSRSPLPDLAAASWKAPTTSGSTGAPKVVRASAPALLDPTQPVSPFLPRDAVQLVCGPMHHSAVFTYAYRGLLTGHRLVILPRFDERAWLEAVEQHGVTWALVVPTMMHRLLRLPAPERAAERIQSLETVLHLGAPCAPTLKRAFLDWVGPSRLIEVYAGSESNGLTMINGDEWLAHPGSVGRPIGGTEIQIRDLAGAELPVGTIGEIWMRRGDIPAYDYIGARSRRDVKGWDTLGDVGKVDADGYLYVVDRADDLINRGGEKIAPATIEQALERHPEVRSAVAFGVPDAELGERIEAVADIATADVTSDELRDWARTELGSRAPTRIRIFRTPVRDDAGKTSRRRWQD